MKVTAHKYVAFLFCLLCPTWWSCFKHTIQPPDNPYGLPNATQKGANVYAFRLNGHNVVTTNTPTTSINGQIRNDSIFVDAISKYGNVFVLLQFALTPATQLNRPFDLSDTTSGNAHFAIDSTCSSYAQFVQVLVKTGTLTISRADPVNRIISGTFNCKTRVDSCSDIIISDGRFDLYYF